MFPTSSKPETITKGKRIKKPTIKPVVPKVPKVIERVPKETALNVFDTNIAQYESIRNVHALKFAQNAANSQRHLGSQHVFTVPESLQTRTFPTGTHITPQQMSDLIGRKLNKIENKPIQTGYTYQDSQESKYDTPTKTLSFETPRKLHGSELINAARIASGKEPLPGTLPEAVLMDTPPKIKTVRKAVTVMDTIKTMGDEELSRMVYKLRDSGEQKDVLVVLEAEKAKRKDLRQKAKDELKKQQYMEELKNNEPGTLDGEYEDQYEFAEQAIQTGSEPGSRKFWATGIVPRDTTNELAMRALQAERTALNNATRTKIPNNTRTISDRWAAQTIRDTERKMTPSDRRGQYKEVNDYKMTNYIAVNPPGESGMTMDELRALIG
jgi:hypothetical protein